MNVDVYYLLGKMGYILLVLNVDKMLIDECRCVL